MALDSISGKILTERLQRNPELTAKSEKSAYKSFAATLEGKAKQQEDTAVREDFKEEVKEYEAMVEKRIKEGPPKFQIGGEEFSEDEWETLLKRIDKDIDAYKEELRERIRKQQEKEALEEGKSGAIDPAEEWIC